MKLHWSPRSPYVRKVMVVAHEVGVSERLDLVRTRVMMAEVNLALMSDNPLGKIPTLVLDDGRVVFDSFVICQYLASQGVGLDLFPSEPGRNLDALTRHALGQGLADALVILRNERIRPADLQSAGILSALPTKVTATLDVLERDADRMSELPFDIGAAAIGTSLAYMDFRFDDFSWREGRPSLAAWQAAFDARPSAIRTAIEDD